MKNEMNKILSIQSLHIEIFANFWGDGKISNILKDEKICKSCVWVHSLMWKSGVECEVKTPMVHRLESFSKSHRIACSYLDKTLMDQCRQ